ncbi:hypothetical protein C100_06030 [Sphingobium sp. C100]|nr:hypothetical protein C100_06030 [Sphingobium sp. C100]
MDQPHRQRLFRRAQHAFHHRAAIIRLGHHLVRAMHHRRRRDRARPAFGPHAPDARIRDHIGAPVAAQPGDDDAARIAIGRSGRVDRHHHARQHAAVRHMPHPAPLDQVARPQRAFRLLDQLAVQFLPPQPRAAIAVHHRRDEAGRQIGRIVRRPPARHHQVAASSVPGPRHQRPHQRHRPWRRRRHRARVAAQPHPHHQIMPGRLAARPFGDFVGPAMAELRPAQRFRLGRAEQRRHRAIGPGQLAQRGRIGRPRPSRRYRQQPRRALHHHAARLAQRRAHQGDPRGRIGLCDAQHPFRARARLAETAPRHHQPDAPVPFGRQLLAPGHKRPFPFQRSGDARRQFPENLLPLGLRPAIQPIPIRNLHPPSPIQPRPTQKKGRPTGRPFPTSSSAPRSARLLPACRYRRGAMPPKVTRLSAPSFATAATPMK